jgi:hypothetical protein
MNERKHASKRARWRPVGLQRKQAVASLLILRALPALPTRFPPVRGDDSSVCMDGPSLGCVHLCACAHVAARVSVSVAVCLWLCACARALLCVRSLLRRGCNMWTVCGCCACACVRASCVFVFVRWCLHHCFFCAVFCSAIVVCVCVCMCHAPAWWYGMACSLVCGTFVRFMLCFCCQQRPLSSPWAASRSPAWLPNCPRWSATPPAALPSLPARGGTSGDTDGTDDGRSATRQQPFQVCQHEVGLLVTRTDGRTDGQTVSTSSSNSSKFASTTWSFL